MLRIGMNHQRSFNCHRAALSKSTASAAKWRKHFNVRVSDLHVLMQVTRQAKRIEQNFSLILKSVEVSKTLRCLWLRHLSFEAPSFMASGSFNPFARTYKAGVELTYFGVGGLSA